MAAEQVEYFSWWGYLFIGFLYSTFVFSKEVPEDRPSIFSMQNKRSPVQILLMHSSFLALLYLVARMFAHIAGYLPHWITNEYDMGEGSLSVADVLFFIGAALLAAYEKHVLFPGTTESQ
jgi:hypothetical protein